MKRRSIKIHNELAMAKYKMSLSEQKLFIYAVRNIDQEKFDFPISTFTVVEFVKASDLELTHVYKNIDDMITSLMKTVICIKNSKDSKKWHKYNLTQNCSYNNGLITFKFNNDMKSFLLQLQEQYYLQSPVVITFKSWFSMRMYDIFKAHLYKQTDLYLDLDELKDILDLRGKYSRFNNFRQKVVDVSINEINEKSDIKVSYTKETVRSKVVGLKFNIESKINIDMNNNLKIMNVEDIRLKANLTDANFSDRQVLTLYECAVERFKEYRDEDDIFLYMFINYRYTRKQNPGNIFGYYKMCLMKDYAYAIPQVLTGYVIDDFA